MTAALSACDSPLAPLPDAAPGSFEFVYGGFGYGTQSWVLRGDTIVMVRIREGTLPQVPPDSARIVPTADSWRAFWASADRAGIRHWRSRYNAGDIIDGDAWHLVVASGPLAIESRGSNAYPDSRGREPEGQHTEAFVLFATALRDLSGRGIYDD